MPGVGVVVVYCCCGGSCGCRGWCHTEEYEGNSKCCEGVAAAVVVVVAVVPPLRDDAFRVFLPRKDSDSLGLPLFLFTTATPSSETPGREVSCPKCCEGAGEIEGWKSEVTRELGGGDPSSVISLR